VGDTPCAETPDVRDIIAYPSGTGRLQYITHSGSSFGSFIGSGAGNPYYLPINWSSSVSDGRFWLHFGWNWHSGSAFSQRKRSRIYG